MTKPSNQISNRMTIMKIITASSKEKVQIWLGSIIIFEVSLILEFEILYTFEGLRKKI